jgi:hypothetical protein
MGTKEICIAIGSVILGVILGGSITWFWSKHYYEKASKELKGAAAQLKKEAEEVRRLTNLILLGLESKGIMTLTRDAKGNITGFALTINVHDAVHAVDGTSPSLAQTAKGEEERKGGEPD